MEAGNGQIHRSDEREEMKLIIDTDPGIRCALSPLFPRYI